MGFLIRNPTDIFSQVQDRRKCLASQIQKINDYAITVLHTW